MNIQIKATGIQLTPAISDYTNKKISVLGKYIDKAHSASLAQVEVGKTSNHHNKGKDLFKAEVRISGAGLDMYAVAEAEDLYSAIDMVENEAAREILKTKGRRVRMMRRGERAIKNMIKGFPWTPKRFRRDI